MSQDCLSAWGTIHWGPSLFLQAAGIDGLFPGEQGLSSSHLYHLIRLSPRVSVFSPYLSPPINQWDHIKWNSELAIPLLKSFWGVLLQGAPDPECEPVTHRGWCTAGLLAPRPTRHHIHHIHHIHPWPSCLNHSGFLSALWTHRSTYLEQSSRFYTWLTPIHLFIPA